MISISVPVPVVDPSVLRRTGRLCGRKGTVVVLVVEGMAISIEQSVVGKVIS
jgi:hypothetical protein